MSERIKHKSPYVQEIMDVWHDFHNDKISAGQRIERLDKIEEKYNHKLPLKVKKDAE